MLHDLETWTWIWGDRSPILFAAWISLKTQKMAGYFLLRSNKNRSTWLPKKVPQNAPLIGSVLVKNPHRRGVLPETTPGHKGVVGPLKGATKNPKISSTSPGQKPQKGHDEWSRWDGGEHDGLSDISLGYTVYTYISGWWLSPTLWKMMEWKSVGMMIPNWMEK